MAQLEKELEKQLVEAGNRLFTPPSSVSELLALLDRVDNFLTGVEQSPSESMKKALFPSMKALIADELLRHSDVDVKVFVASCISEITRITAPDAPYEDEEMKEVFQLIVSSFEKLDDKSSPSYIKRTAILETVAKVRSCVVMLDLECDELIFKMFEHFFRSIRDDHPENVFSSMETIMTLVLDESEDISLDLLSSILDFLQTENKGVRPIACQLAEKVIVKCASKLKPYILPAVKSRGAALDDYNKIVANICQMRPEAVEPNDGDAASKNLTDECDLANARPEKAVEVAMETLDDAPPNEEVGPISVGLPKPIMSNGTLQEVEDTSAGNVNSEEENHETHDRVEAATEASKTIAESLVAKEPAKLQSKPEKSNKRKGRETNALKSSSEPSDPSLEHDKKGAVKVLEHQEKDNKEVDCVKAEDSAADVSEPADNEKVPDAAVSSPKTLENDGADVPSSSPSEILADVSRSKKVVWGKKKDDSVQEGEPMNYVDSKKGSSAKNTLKGTGVSETKLHKRSGKKVSSAPGKEAKTPTPVDASNKEDVTNKLDTKSVKHSGKKVVFSSQCDDKKKGQVKATLGKDIAKTPSKDVEKKPLPESAWKSTKGASEMEKASKTSTTKRRSPGKREVSANHIHALSRIGLNIEVWWPEDKKFYKGSVVSYDGIRKKHTVVYTDGDVELLNLSTQWWRLIDDKSAADQGHVSHGETPGESSKTPEGKKAKISVDIGSKPGMTESAAKKEGTSFSKSKSIPKPGKSMEDSSKTLGKSGEDKGGKSKDLKAGIKPSDDKTRKSVGKSKGDDRAATKSKVKFPPISSKSNTNGTGKVKSVLFLSPKVKKDEDAEMSPKPAKKTPENAKGKSPIAFNSQKSGKKRKREAKS